jgi:hypothetical protein
MITSINPACSNAAIHGSLPTSEQMLDELMGPLEYSSGEPRFVDESSDEEHPDDEFSDDGLEEIDEETELPDLIRDANSGDGFARGVVEGYFADNCHSVKYGGSLAFMSRDWIVGDVTGEDVVSQEYAKRHADLLERQLRSRGNSPLISMAIDRVISCYMAAGAKDYLSTVQYEADKLPPEHVAAQESADRRFLIAMQALELAEKLEKPGAAAN